MSSLLWAILSKKYLHGKWHCHIHVYVYVCLKCSYMSHAYHPKVNGLSFYGYNWKIFQMIVAILVSLHGQQMSTAVAHISCTIFDNEVRLHQKHYSLALDCAMD